MEVKLCHEVTNCTDCSLVIGIANVSENKYYCKLAGIHSMFKMSDINKYPRVLDSCPFKIFKCDCVNYRSIGKGIFDIELTDCNANQFSCIDCPLYYSNKEHEILTMRKKLADLVERKKFRYMYDYTTEIFDGRLIIHFRYEQVDTQQSNYVFVKNKFTYNGRVYLISYCEDVFLLSDKPKKSETLVFLEPDKRIYSLLKEVEA